MVLWIYLCPHSSCANGIGDVGVGVREGVGIVVVTFLTLVISQKGFFLTLNGSLDLSMSPFFMCSWRT